MPSRLEAFGLTLIADDAPRTPAVHAARTFLAGCAGLYDAGLGVYLLSETVGLRRREHLPIPVVSIGNLTVGGTGKTPMTQLLCRALTGQGKRVAILSRGHGGAHSGASIVSDGSEVILDAAQAGDEPLLLAKTLPGVPVLVGKDRRVTGREALRRFGLDALILDDGFQYWQLARDLDIVLLDARRPFDNGYPLPRGLLREPKRHLSRGQIVVVTRADALDSNNRDRLRGEITRLAPQAEVYFARHEPVGYVGITDLAGSILALDTLRGKTVIALSGIAQPQSFADVLAEAGGVHIARHFVHGDHAVYDVDAVQEVSNAIRNANASALVMTEKDAVKWPDSDSDYPVYALRIAMQVEDEANFLAAVTRRLFRV